MWATAALDDPLAAYSTLVAVLDEVTGVEGDVPELPPGPDGDVVF
jgi:hypothetical protein